MSKNIVLLSDGTGNSNIKNRGTNVFKFYEAVDFNRLSDNPQEQVAFYDDGVGTQDFKPLKILGGAFGWGLARNVRNLYKRLVQAYEPGDKIYLFGFSRGAFTVRTLAGFIASNGILDVSHYDTDKELDKAILQLYETYRAKKTAILESVIYKPLMALLFQAYSGKPIFLDGGETDIEFIGVWDTVDAVGLPFEGATQFWNTFVFRFKFPDTRLHGKVKKACHALSIDDQRQSFQPLLWTDDPRIEQVWFPGVHANVGGGYPQQGLSLVALDWMLDKARAVGLQFVKTDLEFVRDKKYVFDKLYDSRSGLGVYYRYMPRDVKKISAKNGIPKPQIHISAFQRIAQGVFGYSPGNLPMDFDVVDNDGIQGNSQKIVAFVNSAIAGKTPPFEQANKFIHLRRVLYYTFLAYTLVTLGWLLWDDVQDKGVFGGLGAALKTLVSPDSLLDKIGLLLWHNLWLTAIGILIFFASYAVSNKIAGIFSEFWSRLRAPLKPLV